ncbi:hypothetical protein B0H14DRAFT_2288534, partial [Mycena olivaceomarginata]
DPTLLCNYCDELLPLVKSSKLLEMEERLLTISWEDPVPDNVLHRRTASVVKTVDYCVRHRFESQHLPNGLTAGWPLKPDFSTLFRRILELGRLCVFFAKTFPTALFSWKHENITRVNRLNCSLQWHNMHRQIVLLSKAQASAYGERGYEIFNHTLHFMFPDHCLNLEDFYPLAHEMIIRQVLIPETAVRIIQADLNLDTEAAAAAIIADSHMFGIVLHP